ncbi:TRAP transporter permease [Oricola thermophila]|uniref:TRAP transporter fused permease subunit n=1 Tax=Oricola thermophila TaxID=2742145 RepID=A0A6N1VDY3_9HYPH|nr:TRAP transporter fused permease subunit [Oricola thermophila]QKV19116.1 TRAP transporter fused permease subunit [Oricola thermophila]
MTSTETLLSRQRMRAVDALFHWLVAVLCTFYVFIHLYIGIYGSPDSQLLNALHVNTALAIVFMTMPLLRRDHPAYLFGRVLDFLALCACVGCTIYFMMEIKTWSIRTLIFRPVDYVTSVIFIALILEACRRAVGGVLVVICLVLMAYALTSDHFGGMFYGAPASPTRLLQTIFLGNAGIFGVAVTVMAQYVVLFILFGVLLNAVGGGRFFTRLAFALFGHRRGGPAKAAVVSSAMLGTISGSAIGNVVTTGIFTIPLMIKLGYRRAFAGGVEAAASNGGMISPPIMGAVAFIMADLMGVSYLTIIAAAAIPALLYYMTMFVTIDLEARKYGLAPLPRGKLPAAGPMLRKQGYFLIPLIVICVALVLGYSIVFVAVMTIATTFIIGILRSNSRLDPARLMGAIEETARSTAGLSATAAAAGIMLGAIFAVGLSFQVAQEAARMADGNLWILVMLCGVMAIIMGMGMSAAAVYLTLAATVVPIMQVAGISQMAAHFYAFYFGIASNITPPVALTAYAAAPIAGSKPIETGFYAAKLGISNLLLPILFVYHPAILLEGSWGEIATVSITSLLALIGFAAVTTGYLFAGLNVTERLVGAIGSLLLFIPEPATDLAGLVAIALWAAYSWRKSRRRQEAVVPIQESAVSDGGGWLNRWASGRMAKEGEAAIGQTSRNEDELLEMLVSDAEDGAVRAQARERFSQLSLYLAWGAVLLTSGLFQFSGSNYIHARDPILWTAVMLLAAVFFVSSIWTVVRWRPVVVAVPRSQS